MDDEEANSKMPAKNYHNEGDDGGEGGDQNGTDVGDRATTEKKSDGNTNSTEDHHQGGNMHQKKTNWKEKLQPYARSDGTFDSMTYDQKLKIMKDVGATLQDSGEIDDILSNRVPGLKPFTVDHVLGVTPQTTKWTDCAKGMDFLGRNCFFRAVQHKLGILTPPTSPDDDSVNTLHREETKRSDSRFAFRPGGPLRKLQKLLTPSTSASSKLEGGRNFMLTPTNIIPGPNSLITPSTRAIASAGGDPDRKTAYSLVYSSVSGSGKTVAMLRLKEKLPSMIEGSSS